MYAATATAGFCKAPGLPDDAWRCRSEPVQSSWTHHAFLSAHISSCTTLQVHIYTTRCSANAHCIKLLRTLPPLSGVPDYFHRRHNLPLTSTDAQISDRETPASRPCLLPQRSAMCLHSLDHQSYPLGATPRQAVSLHPTVLRRRRPTPLTVQALPVLNMRDTTVLRTPRVVEFGPRSRSTPTSP